MDLKQQIEMLHRGERRGLCCWGFLHRAPLVARSVRLPEVATTSERGSCCWQLPIMSFANQFLLQPDHTISILYVLVVVTLDF